MLKLSIKRRWQNGKIGKILELENYKIIKIEERSENKKMIKIINVETKNKNKDAHYVENIRVVFSIN